VAFRNARLVIANSTKTAIDVCGALGVPARRVVTVAFGADPPVKRAREPSSTRTIGFVGAHGWDDNKGLDIALEAFRSLSLRSATHLRMVVVGPGDVSRWRKVAGGLGLADSVDFRGQTDDMQQLLGGLDLLVSPSQYEAYGLTVQEALIAGVPTLVSSDAGVAARLVSSLPELLVRDKASSSAWSSAMQAALDDLERLRKATEQVGTELAQRSWRAMAEEIALAVDERLGSSENGSAPRSPRIG
jgi:glycosyltransferase involved in cell wall biosynthesis